MGKKLSPIITTVETLKSDYLAEWRKNNPGAIVNESSVKLENVTRYGYTMPQDLLKLRDIISGHQELFSQPKRFIDDEERPVIETQFREGKKSLSLADLVALLNYTRGLLLENESLLHRDGIALALFFGIHEEGIDYSAPFDIKREDGNSESPLEYIQTPYGMVHSDNIIEFVDTWNQISKMIIHARVLKELIENYQSPHQGKQDSSSFSMDTIFEKLTTMGLFADEMMGLLTKTEKMRVYVANFLRGEDRKIEIRPRKLHKLPEKLKALGRTYLFQRYGNGSDVKNTIQQIFRSPRKRRKTKDFYR